MNEVEMFDFENQNVRVVTINNESWFVLKDICGILGLSDVSMVGARLDDDEKADTSLACTSSNGVTQNRNTIVVNESGLYSVILRSDKPEAKKFKKWITSEVLPSIRKNGGYLSTAVDFTDPDKVQILLDAWKADRKRLDQANGRIERLVHNTTCYNTSEIAKELNYKSAQELNKELSERGIIYKDGRGVWLLYAEYCGKGFQEIKQKELDGKVVYYATWTGLGRDWLVGLLNQNIL